MTITREDLKKVLTVLLQGIATENNYEIDSEAAYLKLTGDPIMASTLHIMTHWSNDLVCLAAHYGITLVKVAPDGEVIHADGTIESLLKEGKWAVHDVSAAPSDQHYFYKGIWNEPEKEDFTDVAVPTTEYQVVYAPDRGDTCYAGKSGWWYHRLDEACGIIPASLRGPFDSEDLAVEGIRNAL